MQHKKPETMERIKDFALNYYRENNHMPGIRAIAEGISISRGAVQKYLVEMGNRGMIVYDGGIVSIPSTSTIADVKETYNAGIIGSIACGIPADATEYVEDYVPLPISIFGSGELYILRADGDSMIEAGIDDGDLVVVRRAEEANDGDIVVALVDATTTTLKRIFHDDKNQQVILHPENHTMADIIVPSCQIQGVAVNVIKRL